MTSWDNLLATWPEEGAAVDSTPPEPPDMVARAYGVGAPALRYRICYHRLQYAVRRTVMSFPARASTARYATVMSARTAASPAVHKVPFCS